MGPLFCRLGCRTADHFRTRPCAHSYGTTMSATKSYFEDALVMDEELTQHDGIAIAATTGNWNSRRRNGHIIGACWQSAAVSRLQAPLMQAVKAAPCRPPLGHVRLMATIMGIAARTERKRS